MDENRDHHLQTKVLFSKPKIDSLATEVQERWTTGMREWCVRKTLTIIMYASHESTAAIQPNITNTLSH